jgi:hypothetical protein
MKALLLGTSLLVLGVFANACGGASKHTTSSVPETPRPQVPEVTAAQSTTPGARSVGGIELVHDTLSFCIELHSGRRQFQIQLRNTRRIANRVSVSVENGPHVGFTLSPTSHVRVLRGAWNGKHHTNGCRTTIAWDHTQLTITLPLAQE